MSPGISLITLTELKEAPIGFLCSVLAACTIASFITSQINPPPPIAGHGANVCAASALRVQIDAADEIGK